MYMRGLKPANMVAASFGSYGWSGEAVKMMNEIIKELDVVLATRGSRSSTCPGTNSSASV